MLQANYKHHTNFVKKYKIIVLYPKPNWIDRTLGNRKSRELKVQHQVKSGIVFKKLLYVVSTLYQSTPL